MKNLWSGGFQYFLDGYFFRRAGIKFEFRLKHGKNIPYHIMTWFYIFSDPMTDERRLGRAINQWHKLILVVFWEILIFHLQIKVIFVIVWYSIRCTVMAFFGWCQWLPAGPAPLPDRPVVQKVGWGVRGGVGWCCFCSLVCSQQSGMSLRRAARWQSWRWPSPCPGWG